MASSVGFSARRDGFYRENDRVDLRQKREVIRFCERGDLKSLRRFLGKNRDLDSIKTPEGLNLFQVCLINKKFDLASYLLINYPDMEEEEVEEFGHFGFYLYQRGMHDELHEIIKVYPSFLKNKDESGESLFFKAFIDAEFLICETALRLMPTLIRSKNIEGKGLLRAAIDLHPNLQGHIDWLFERANYIPRKGREIDQLVEFIKQTDEFDFNYFERIITEETLHMFVSHLDFLINKCDIWRIRDFLTSKRKLFPESFYGPLSKSPLLEQDALAAYYNEKIKDVKEIQNPYKSLRSIFYTTLKTDFFAKVERFDSEKDRRAQAGACKDEEIKQVHRLFKAISCKKQDASIPQGREKLYYFHLERILKHLAIYLKKEKNRSETLTYLSDLASCSGHCYTHFSTVIHSIYVRLTGDQGVNQEHQAELPYQRFEDKIRKQFSVKIQAETAPYLQSQDAHVAALLHAFFIEARLPVETEAMIDSQKFAASLTVRSEILKENLSEEDLLFVESDEDFIEETKEAFLEMFRSKHLNLKFMNQTLIDFLDQGLNELQDPAFLLELTDWLEQKRISAHDIIKFKRDGTYHVREKGVCKLLKKFPKVIQL
jgi:hypothetical protein